MIHFTDDKISSYISNNDEFSDKLINVIDELSEDLLYIKEYIIDNINIDIIYEEDNNELVISIQFIQKNVYDEVLFEKAILYYDKYEEILIEQDLNNVSIDFDVQLENENVKIVEIISSNNIGE